MIIGDLHLIRVSVFPDEAEAITVVDSNAVLSGAAAFQCLQRIARRPQIMQRPGRVQLKQLPKNSLLTRELLDSHGEALVRKAVLQALKGDVPTLRALLAHILPRHTEPPVKTGPLPMGTAEEISQSSQALLQKVASGKITPSQARDIHAMLEAQRKIVETESFDNRLRAIEQRVQGEPGKDPVSLGPADPPA